MTTSTSCTAAARDLARARGILWDLLKRPPGSYDFLRDDDTDCRRLCELIDETVLDVRAAGAATSIADMLASDRPRVRLAAFSALA